MKVTRPRSGFTLVELLVVIAIIGTLMGLLLPAVQSAREAGRRNTCSNNLNQLGKAVMAYEGQNSSMPGWRNQHPAGPAATISAGAVGWVVPLLPNLERSDIYRLYESGTVGNVPSVSLLQCPTSPPDDPNAPTLAYAGNAGSSFLNVATVPPSQIRGDGPVNSSTKMPTYSASRSNLDMISSADGTSNTLLFSEKCGSLVVQTAWSAFVPPSASSPQLLSFSPVGSDPRFDIAAAFGIASTPGVGKIINSPTAPSAADASFNAQPSSNHPGGVVVTFCDGHTEFLRDSIAPHVYAQLVTSDSKFAVGAYTTNSPLVNGWLTSAGAPIPYTLNEGDFR
jgi:prepilin-type N-terminal cleavage/methylation domain-containing protein/prepilin-type processing-associated H-X9-DG protein